MCRLSSWALRSASRLFHGTWDLSSLTKGWTHVPCIARQILHHWTTRGVPGLLLLKLLNLLLSYLIYSQDFDNRLFTDNSQVYNYLSNLFSELQICRNLSVYIANPQNSAKNQLIIFLPRHHPSPIFPVLVSGTPILLVLWHHSWHLSDPAFHEESSQGLPGLPRLSSCPRLLPQCQPTSALFQTTRGGSKTVSLYSCPPPLFSSNFYLSHLFTHLILLLKIPQRLFFAYRIQLRFLNMT